MMIAPNRFFLDCIYNILLDLGVNDVNQCNFEEFAEQVIDAGVKIESSKDKLANMVNNNGKYKKDEVTLLIKLEFKYIQD